MGKTVDRAAKNDVVAAHQPGMRFQLRSRISLDADAYIRGAALAGEDVLTRKRLGKAAGARHKARRGGNALSMPGEFSPVVPK